MTRSELQVVVSGNYVLFNTFALLLGDTVCAAAET